ncbi:MAG: tetratricopeptide repeat protein [Planctomycetes bacterium]|nr:tetratricopeptide repeat protein [Planctomycetota bacterium]
MRSYWYFFLTYVAVTTGCTSGGFPGGSTVAQQSFRQQAPMASMQTAGPKTPGFTQRVASSISSVIPGMGTKAETPEPPSTKLDPISLGFASGPPNAELYMSMAELSDRGGNADHARSMYQKSLSIEPNHRDALLGLARLEDRQGRMNDALRIYQQAAVAHPRDAKVLNDLALCYARTGQFAASAELLNQASLIQPQKKLYRNNFAKVLIEMNRVDEAISQLAVVHPPAIVQYNVGVLLNERGRTGEAVRFLTAATHIDPQLQAASTLLAQISGSANQLAQTPNPAANDNILPTPMMPATQTATLPYPTTNAPAQPAYQAMPAETAQVPVSEMPVLLPPVR